MAAINYLGKMVDVGGGLMGLQTPNQGGVIFYVDYTKGLTETGIKIKIKVQDSNLNPINSIDPVNFKWWYVCEMTSSHVAQVIEHKVQETGRKIIPTPLPVTATAVGIEVSWDGVPDATSTVNVYAQYDSLRYI